MYELLCRSPERPWASTPQTPESVPDTDLRLLLRVRDGTIEFGRCLSRIHPAGTALSRWVVSAL